MLKMYMIGMVFYKFSAVVSLIYFSRLLDTQGKKFKGGICFEK